MKKLSSLLLLIIAVQFSIAQPFGGRRSSAPQHFSPMINATAEGFSAQRLQKLDKWIRDNIAAETMPNLVMFVARNGKIIYHKAYGYSNRGQLKTASTTDIYRIASQTKAIASVALMTLFEEGRFMLDEPISKYFPAFKNPQVLVSYDTLNPLSGTYQTRAAKSEITIRQLLSHTAGIPYEHPLEGRPEFSVPYLNSMNPDKLEDVINRLAKRPLIRDPGEGFVYGLNTDIIGRLIEILSGKPLDQAIAERVTIPLGMKDTWFYLPKEKEDRLVELYSKEKATDPITVHANDTFRFYPVAGARSYFSAGAGMVSTALDYAKFCQMILNGGTFNNQRILSRHTIEMMTRNQIGDAEVWTRRDKFGLGFQIVTPQTQYADIASPGSITWGGAYCSEYTIDPAEGLVIQFFTNVSPYGQYDKLTLTLRTLVYQALE